MRKVLVLVVWCAAVILVGAITGKTEVCAYEYYDEENELDENEFEEDDTEEEEEGEFVDDEEDEIESVTVYFDENGGDITGISELTVNYGEPYGTLPDVKKAGFVFLGWYTKAKGGEQITAKSICTQTDDLTLHAHWKCKNGYTITYKLGTAGINHPDNPESYTEKTAAISLKDAASPDAAFGGWYADADYKVRVKKIKKGSKGNLTLYARWLPKPLISKVTVKKNKVTLSWKVCPGAQKYKLFQATSVNGKYKACASVKAASATVANLSYNKNYYFKIVAVYSVDGKQITTEKGAAVEVCCNKTSSSGKSGKTAAAGNTESRSVTSGQAISIPFYYQYDNWKFASQSEKSKACFCCSPAMVLNAMGYDCDPNRLYEVMGGIAFKRTEVEKKYGVKITVVTLTGSAAQRKQALCQYLLTRPQGIMIRKNNVHTQVAFLKDGEIKVHDSGRKNGACVDISNSQIKSYANVDLVYLVDKK